MPKEFFSPREIANELDVPYLSVLNAVHMGVLPAKKVRGRWHISPEGFAAFHAKNRVEKAIYESVVST